MKRIIIKGGYGEHGRSCFMLEYKQNHYCMVDFGILDTDINPLPKLTEEEIKKLDYLFLTHCHKDHTGAVSFLIEKGFKGTIIASKETIAFSDIKYPYIIYIDTYLKEIALNKLSFISGRSGHCPGALWFLIKTEEDNYFFSGDYQQNSLVTICDKASSLKAKVAFIDNAHDLINEDAFKLRMSFIKIIKEKLEENIKIFLPLQKYGRSVEILYLLKTSFPDLNIALSKNFKESLLNTLTYKDWISEKNANILKEYILSCTWNYEKAEIVISPDTHIEKEATIKIANDIYNKGGLIIATGRKKKGSYMALLLDQHKAISFPYPHHNSMLDAKNLVKQNDFDIVLPFHNENKEIWLNK